MGTADVMAQVSGGIVVRENVEEFGSAVARVMSDAELRAQLSAKARIDAERWSSRSFAERLVRLYGKVVDAEVQVEKALIQELETAFKDFGIEARILSVEGPQLVGRNHLEIPLQVREDRQVRLP